MQKYILTCPHCGEKLNSWLRGNFKGRFLHKKPNTLLPRHFCTEECYSTYKENYIVEIYNDQPIYCVEIAGEKRYMPYFEANYYFTDINDCKKRMDMKGVAVVDLSMYSIMR